MYSAKTAIDNTIDNLMTDEPDTTNQTLTKQIVFC